MVLFLSFILEFIGLFVTLFRSSSLTNINIPFIETSTILKHFFLFFASFFTQNITHFYSILLNYHNEKAKTQPFWAAIDGELRGKRSGNKRRRGREMRRNHKKKKYDNKRKIYEDISQNEPIKIPL